MISAKFNLIKQYIYNIHIFFCPILRLEQARLAGFILGTVLILILIESRVSHVET